MRAALLSGGRSSLAGLPPRTGECPICGRAMRRNSCTFCGAYVKGGGSCYTVRLARVIVQLALATS